MVALTAEASGLGTPTHPAWQLTSPEGQAATHCWVGVREMVGAGEVLVSVPEAAMVKAAKPKVITMVENFILNGSSSGQLKLIE